MEQELRRTRFFAGVAIMLGAFALTMVEQEPTFKHALGFIQGIGFMVAWTHRAKS